jgi:hypothetical protein
VRFGVFMIALLALVSSLFFGFVFIATVLLQGHNNVVALTQQSKLIFIINGAYYAIVALVSLIGLIGALGRKRGLISTYASFLWVAFFVHLGLGAYAIYRIIEDFNADNDDICSSTNKTDCLNAKTSKIVYISVIAGSSLIYLYGAIIVNRYKHQLDDEDSESWANGPQYQKRFSGAPVPEAHPLSAGHPYGPRPVSGGHHQYPYAAPQNSYGA